MTDDSAAEGHSDLTEACLQLRQLTSALCGSDPRDMRPAEVRRVIRRLRRLRNAVERQVLPGNETMPREQREKVLSLLQRINSACGQASADIGDSLEEMKSALSRLSDQLSKLSSYRHGAAVRGSNGR